MSCQVDAQKSILNMGLGSRSIAKMETNRTEIGWLGPESKRSSAYMENKGSRTDCR
jgi:hypothetical protein